MDDLRTKVHEAVDVLVDFLHGVVATMENKADEVEDKVENSVSVANAPAPADQPAPTEPQSETPTAPEVPESVANTPVGQAPTPPPDPTPVTPAEQPISVIAQGE